MWYLFIGLSSALPYYVLQKISSLQRYNTFRKKSCQLKALWCPSVSLTLAIYTLLLWQFSPSMLDKQTQLRSRHCVCPPSAHLKVFLQALLWNEGDQSFMGDFPGSHSILWVCICTCRNQEYKAKNADDLIKAGIKSDEFAFIKDMLWNHWLELISLWSDLFHLHILAGICLLSPQAHRCAK